MTPGRGRAPLERTGPGIAGRPRHRARTDPGQAEIALDPQLALALFVAPALLDAAYDTSRSSPRDETIGDDAYHRIERILDRTGLYAEAGRTGPPNG